MHRFHLPPPQCQGESLTLEGDEAHHALHGVRVRVGETVVVLDGHGQELMAEVTALHRHTVNLLVRQRHRQPPLPYHITLAQAVTKGKSMETILQKATELGAQTILPVLAERSVVHLDEEHAGDKLEKWQRIVIEAAKQCGSAWLPKVEPARSLAPSLDRPDKSELVLAATLQPDARHPRVHLDAFLRERGRMPSSVTVWIGPEGDFTPAEVHAIKGSGALSITLGQRILRSETAAIYCLSLLSYELQDPRS